MIKVKMTERDFADLMSYYEENKKYGSIKYFWEISVPDSEYEQFERWLRGCSRLEFTFAFAVIERYEGHKLLYGFTNFEVIENDNIKCFDFKFDNFDILYDKFTLWKDESSYFIMPLSLKVFFETMKAFEKESEKIRLYHSEENKE